MDFELLFYFFAVLVDVTKSKGLSFLKEVQTLGDRWQTDAPNTGEIVTWISDHRSCHRKVCWVDAIFFNNSEAI